MTDGGLKITYPFGDCVSKDIDWLVDHGFSRVEDSSGNVFDGTIKIGDADVSMTLVVVRDSVLHRWSCRVFSVVADSSVMDVSGMEFVEGDSPERAIEMAAGACMEKIGWRLQTGGE